MGNASTQLAIVPDRQPAVCSDSQDSCEEIQKKLLSLRLQQEQIQTRIRILRHAMSVLIQAFGPAILSDHLVVCEASHPAIGDHPPLIDLCRMILGESKQWLTIRQIHETIRIKYPFSAGGFLKPGTAISNALRTLYRHGAVETKLNSGIREWRSVSVRVEEAS